MENGGRHLRGPYGAPEELRVEQHFLEQREASKDNWRRYANGVDSVVKLGSEAHLLKRRHKERADLLEKLAASLAVDA